MDRYINSSKKKNNIYSLIFKSLWLIFFINPIVFAQNPGDLIWNASVGWHVHSIVPVEDVNDDGFADIFVGSGDDIAYCFSGGGVTAGSILWSWYTGVDVWSVAAISDVNNDGANDCIAGVGNDTVYCFSGKPISGLTKILWSYSLGGDAWSVSTISDLNGDNIDECLIGSGDDKVTCLDGSSGYKIWSYTANSDILTVCSIADVNGDGKDDCLAGGRDDYVRCISGASINTGTVLWYYKTGSTVLSLTSFNDVNNDGIADCLAGGEDDKVYCISGKSSGKATVLWSKTRTATIKSVTSIKDVNNDGKDECLAGGQDDTIICLSGTNGNLIWSYKTGSTVLSVSTVSDVNGNGGQDCIAGGQDNTIYCIEGKSSGTGQIHWTANTEGSVICVTSISDLNDNGVDDVIGGSDDSYIYVLEGGNTVTESISTPTIPSGSSTGKINQSLTFVTSGSSSNLGHAIEYRFDWGDGTGYSSWGSSSQSHAYQIMGAYSVKAQARCQTHTGVVSSWSSGKSVTISGHTMTITISGSGTVGKNPNKSEYNHNENVTLTPNPSSGWYFDQWGGHLSGSTNPVTIIMNSDKNISATFKQTSETVTVPSSPGGSSSGKVGNNISFSTGGSSSNLGHAVEYRFDWGDGGGYSTWGSSSRNHIYQTIGSYIVKAQARCQTHTGVVSSWSSGKSIVISGHQLSITISGSGTVGKNPNKSEYNHNENITLTSNPSSGWHFDQWGNDISGNTNPYNLVMNGDKYISASFLQIQETVSTPATPTGPSIGEVGETLQFSAGGSSSNLGHNLEYRFNWGDGIISSWGSASQNHSWSVSDSYLISAQSRCVVHPTIESAWSSVKILTIQSTEVNENQNVLPNEISLQQNYPNPFNMETVITFHLPEATEIQVDVFNLSGRLVATLTSGYYKAGIHETLWNGRDKKGNPVSSGIFVYRLTTETQSLSKEMMIVK